MDTWGFSGRVPLGEGVLWPLAPLLLSRDWSQGQSCLSRPALWYSTWCLNRQLLGKMPTPLARFLCRLPVSPQFHSFGIHWTAYFGVFHCCVVFLY